MQENILRKQFFGNYCGKETKVYELIRDMIINELTLPQHNNTMS